MTGRSSTISWSFLQRVGDSAWFSYATIFVLQIAVIWNVWNADRLGFGDTSSYFSEAARFAERGEVANIVMSPLYTMFYGTIYAVIGDPHRATWLHRAIIVVVAALAALAVFRRLLPPPVAWGLAFWWAISPIIYDTLYEVHLFGVLPVLAACIAARATDRPWGRGTALAILLAGGLLVRNELTAAAIVFAGGCLWWEWHSASTRRHSATEYLLAYLLPLALAAAITGAFYLGVREGFSIERTMDRRHRLNMAQVYAFGYQQRHPEWTNNPWTEYADLLTEHFGIAEPSLTEMISNNPRAALDHFLWNLRLTPSGLQLLLFSEISGETNPDYPAPPMRSKRALAGSIAVVALWIAGGYLIIKRWNWWWAHRIRDRVPAWLVLIAVSSVTPLIILSQRPRPSYLFGLAAFLMAVTGLCATALAYGRAATRLSAQWPVAALALLAAVAALPYRYPAKVNRMVQIFPHVARLRPFRESLSQPGVRLVGGMWNWPLQSYACQNGCSMGKAWKPGEMDLLVYLENNGGTHVYLDEISLARLEAASGSLRPFVDYLPEPWQILAYANDETGRWRLYHRADAP